MKNMVMLLAIAAVVIAGVYVINKYRESDAYMDLTPANAGVEAPTATENDDFVVDRGNGAFLGQSRDELTAFMEEAPYTDKDRLVQASNEAIERMEEQVDAMQGSSTEYAAAVIMELEAHVDSLKQAVRRAEASAEGEWDSAKQGLSNEYAVTREKFRDVWDRTMAE